MYRRKFLQEEKQKKKEIETKSKTERNAQPSNDIDNMTDGILFVLVELEVD